MEILKEIEEMRKKLNILEEEIKKQNNSCKLADIKIGEKFVYCGHNYTKLNNDGFCIIDDYDSDFMRCIFDPITNNYDESIIRQYINSKRFIDKLGVNTNDLVAHYKEDLITLLSKEEYEEYRDLIRDYDTWWATRSAYSYNAYTFCFIANSGSIANYNVSYAYGVRLGFNLKPETPVDRKGNNEEEMGEDE